MGKETNYDIADRSDCIRVIRKWIRRFNIRPDELYGKNEKGGMKK